MLTHSPLSLALSPLTIVVVAVSSSLCRRRCVVVAVSSSSSSSSSPLCRRCVVVAVVSPLCRRLLFGVVVEWSWGVEFAVEPCLPKFEEHLMVTFTCRSLCSANAELTSSPMRGASKWRMVTNSKHRGIRRIDAHRCYQCSCWPRRAKWVQC